MTFSALDPTHRAGGQAQRQRRGRSGTPTSCRPASTGTTSASARRDKIVGAGGAGRPGLRQQRSSTCTCRRRSTSSASSGLRRGNVMHVEMGLDSMFAYRPLPELAGYRTPVRGLFLTGASTHPGGGVFGASGRTAARVVLAQPAAVAMSAVAYGVRSRRRRRPVPGVGLTWLLAATTVGLEIAYPLVDGAWLHRVTIATVVAFAATCVLHALVHRGLALGARPGRRHRRRRARGRGGRGAHRAAVRRLLLRRHARPRGARRAAGRAAGLDDDGLPGAAGGPPADPALGRAASAPSGWRPGTSSSTRRWSATGTGPGPTRSRRCPASPGIPLTNFAGWLLVGALMMLVLVAVLPRDDPHRPADESVPATLLVWTWLGYVLGNVFWFGTASVALVGGVAARAAGAALRRGRCGSRGPDPRLVRGSAPGSPSPARCTPPGTCAGCGCRRPTRRRSPSRWRCCCRCATRRTGSSRACGRCSRQTGVRDLRVLVLDDGSTDGTADVVRRVAGDDPRVRLLDGAAAAGRLVGQAVGLPPARRRPRGDATVLVFVDADVVLAPHAVAASVALLRWSRAGPGVAVPAAGRGDRRPSGWCSRCCSGPG